MVAKMWIEFDEENRLNWIDPHKITEFREWVIGQLLLHATRLKSTEGKAHLRAQDCTVTLAELLIRFSEGRVVIANREQADTLLACVEGLVEHIAGALRNARGPMVANGYRRHMITGFLYYLGAHELLCNTYDRLPPNGM